MVAAVTIWPDREVVGVHRTFLTANGSSKAPISRVRMMLGKCAGGAVRLATVTAELVVGEGVESSLSVQAATGRPAWAALSAGGIEALVLPDLPLALEIVIAADHDEVGLRAAYAAAEKWTQEGRTVRIAVPPQPGADFNDMAAEETAAVIEKTAA